MYYLDTLAGLIIAVLTAAAALTGPANAQTPCDLVARSASSDAPAVDHEAWDGPLKAYVTPGADGLNRVDYGAFNKDGNAALKTYLLVMSRVDLATLDRREQFAFLANLYNAKTIDIVLDRGPRLHQQSAGRRRQRREPAGLIDLRMVQGRSRRQ